jgi:ribosomal protein RSM22 (predicted rRNA methylase)
MGSNQPIVARNLDQPAVAVSKIDFCRFNQSTANSKFTKCVDYIQRRDATDRHRSMQNTHLMDRYDPDQLS